MISFIQQYYKQLIWVAVIGFIVFQCNVINSLKKDVVVLENNVSVEQSKNKMLNESNLLLRSEIDAQNEKINELAAESEGLKLQQQQDAQTALNEMNEVNKEIDAYLKDNSALTGDICKDIMNELNKVGN